MCLCVQCYFIMAKTMYRLWLELMAYRTILNGIREYVCVVHRMHIESDMTHSFIHIIAGSPSFIIIAACICMYIVVRCCRFNYVHEGNHRAAYHVNHRKGFTKLPFTHTYKFNMLNWWKRSLRHSTQCDHFHAFFISPHRRMKGEIFFSCIEEMWRWFSHFKVAFMVMFPIYDLMDRCTKSWNWFARTYHLPFAQEIIMTFRLYQPIIYYVTNKTTFSQNGTHKWQLMQFAWHSFVYVSLWLWHCHSIATAPALAAVSVRNIQIS